MTCKLEVYARATAELFRAHSSATSESERTAILERIDDMRGRVAAAQATSKFGLVFQLLTAHSVMAVSEIPSRIWDEYERERHCALANERLSENLIVSAIIALLNECPEDDDLKLLCERLGPCVDVGEHVALAA